MMQFFNSFDSDLFELFDLCSWQVQSKQGMLKSNWNATCVAITKEIDLFCFNNHKLSTVIV